MVAPWPYKMTWTTEKPTTPGWYWYRNPFEKERVVRVYGDQTPTETRRVDMWVQLHDETDCNVDDMGENGEWAGPLDPP